jgi:[acyl-carrier-protein] S-malonyltransferase
MKTAAMFAGQGAQAVGMGKDLAEAFPACRDLFDRANDALGYDLAKTCFEGPLETLTRTDVCQPAIFVVSAACLAAARERAPAFAFDYACGLSLGEWTALYAAGVVGFEQCVRILEARGRFMQEACDATPSTMVCILRLPYDKVEALCAASGATMANINSAEQIVLSGSPDACTAAARLAAEAGGRAVPLAVAGAYHSPFMAPAAKALESFLAKEEFHAPAVPVLSNVTGRPHAPDTDSIRRAMVAQVTHPVRWLDSVLWLRSSEAGVGRFVEFGPGKTLSGLVRRIDRTATAANVATLADLEDFGQ